ncbi:MAG TPA: SET domain-containing protein-lysine N-methyltransferase [Mycobacteriales bacterium]|nr:SET domain-containing protein-lysine N-methyltransferase [Mycobacteriales bacterium]
MNDVVVDAGSLAGKGVHAARDFAPGDVVVDYELQPLSEAEYHALPDGEDLFVHSYFGRRYLYPVPARFVNHSNDPSCYQDFDRGCDIALRPIAAGEAITIDATQETDRELATFLATYLDALQARSAADLAGLVGSAAEVWSPESRGKGRDAVVSALLGVGLRHLSPVDWFIGTGRWEALASGDLETAAGHHHHVTLLLRVVDGNWQLTYQHIG